VESSQTHLRPALPKAHVFVLAGGAGSRLRPLTEGLCKPALPFAGNYCVVDFVLGNLWNSQLPQADLLVQHEPAALVEHVRRAWTRSQTPRAGDFVRVASPAPGAAYRGTADAVWQNLAGIPPDADLVLIFGADHVYRMDVRQLIEFHCANQADVTLATLPVPLAQASSFGIVDADGRGHVSAFQEKPAAPAPMPQRPGHALASMGNYVFDARVLRRELALAHARGETDFGQHVLPRLLSQYRLMAYDFTTQRVPGVAPHEDRSYWRDVGTIDAYFGAHLDTLGSRPAFELDNPRWPVLPAATAGPPPLVQGSDLQASCVSAAASVESARLDKCVIGRHARVRSGAQLSRCVLLDRAVVGSGARLHNVIVDRDNVIPPGEVIGHDLARDRERFPVSPGGVVVVPRGYFAAVNGVLKTPRPLNGGDLRQRAQPSLLHG
jgi:glucose-1-phosphate adenylyltransferase